MVTNEYSALRFSLTISSAFVSSSCKHPANPVLTTTICPWLLIGLIRSAPASDAATVDQLADDAFSRPFRQEVGLGEDVPGRLLVIEHATDHVGDLDQHLRRDRPGRQIDHRETVVLEIPKVIPRQSGVRGNPARGRGNCHQPGGGWLGGSAASTDRSGPSPTASRR